MKHLIINADDFGLSPGVNRGIAQAITHGVVTSTTVMGNMMDLPKQLSLLQGTRAGVGVHLTLTAGRPLVDSTAVPSLVNTDGNMRRSYRDAVRLAEVGHVELEWRAQIERVLALGVKPTHLDSHHHVHLAPKLVRLAVRLAKEYRVPAIRRLTLVDVLREDYLWRNIVALPLVLYSQRTMAQYDISYPQRLMSLSMKHLHNLKSLPEGVYEVFCHPGLVDEELKTKSSLLEQREKELNLLTSNQVKEIIKDSGFQLVSYAIYGE